jgi:hypothetical protein
MRILTLCHLVGFEVLAAVIMKRPIFWDIMPCCCACCPLHAALLLGLFLDPEDERNMFFHQTTQHYIPEEKLFLCHPVWEKANRTREADPFSYEYVYVCMCVRARTHTKLTVASLIISAPDDKGRDSFQSIGNSLQPIILAS